MNLPVDTLLQGGKYKIVRFISSGGFGCTYEAQYASFKNKRVAIKEFFMKGFCSRDDRFNVVIETNRREEVEKLKRKFVDEANLLFEMQHPGIVRVIDTFEENGTLYYVMDYIEGESLEKLVNRRGPLPEKEVVGYIRQVADALSYVHGQNRLHLDIKPDNLMLDKNGRVILIDFGISKHYDEETGQNTTTLMGAYTPGYAPPEQMGRSFTTFEPTVDIYALGATLYKLLMGMTPPDAGLLSSGKEVLPPLPTTMGASTRLAVARAMELNQNNRPQSIEEFLAILNKGNRKIASLFGSRSQKKEKSPQPAKEVNPLDDKTVPEQKVQSPVPPVKPTQENREPQGNGNGKWILLGALVILLLVGAGYLFTRQGSNPTPPVPLPADTLAQANEGVDTAVVTPGEVASPDTTVVEPIETTDEIPVEEPVDEEEPEKPEESKGDNDKGKDNDTPAPVESPVEEVETGLTGERHTERVNGVAFNMIRVAGGSFEMGSNNGESDESPVHTVTLSTYYMGETEVTQALWKAVMGTTIHQQRKKSEYDYGLRGEGDNYPMYYVSWEEADAFCKELSRLTGRTYRLPTEAEWEYAARGGNHNQRTQYSGSDAIGDVAWYWGNSSETTHPVGQKKPNALGLYDMTGNVWEWCSDWYDSSYYSSSPTTNPTGPTGDRSGRVARGGSWSNDASYCRVADRGYNTPGSSRHRIGFRLVVEP